MATDLPQLVQNLLPGGNSAPQEGQDSTFSGAPQLEQKFPDASAPHDGHFMIALVVDPFELVADFAFRTTLTPQMPGR